MGRHPTADYGAAPDDPEKQAIISQQSVRYKIIGIWNNNFLNNDDKYKLRTLRTAYTFNNQDDGSGMFFVIVKMVCPDTHT